MSYEIGFAPYFGTSSSSLLIYSVIYFAFVAAVSLYPNKLLWYGRTRIGTIKIVALAILGIAAFAIPTGYISPPTNHYINSPVSEGFVEWLSDDGYVRVHWYLVL